MQEIESIDLGLLPHLEALLSAASVTEAAERVGLSTSAMSRSLSRLRSQTGDALLVRAGQRMVLTPRALALRDALPPLLRELQGLLGPPRGERPVLRRPLRVRSADAIPALFGPALLRALKARVDGAALVFVQEGEEDDEALRSGRVDIDVGVQDGLGPDMMVRALFRDHMVGVAASGHPVLGCPPSGRPAPSARLDAFCEAPHVVVSRRGVAEGPIDALLKRLGRRRSVALVVPGYLDAALIVADGLGLSCMPSRVLGALPAKLGLQAFALPVPTPELEVSLAWHARMNDDPGHKALRAAVLEVVGGAPRGR